MIGPGRNRRSRWVFAVAWAAMVILAGSAVSLSLILRPERVRGWIRLALQSAIQGEVRFAEEIEINPWRLAVALRDLVVTAPDGGGEVIRIRRAAVLPDLVSLLAGRFEARELVIDGPEVEVVRLLDGTWNIARALGPEFLARLSAGDGRSRWPEVRLRGGRITVRDEQAVLSDLPGFLPDPPVPVAADGSPPETGAPPAKEITLSEVTLSAVPRRGVVNFKGEARHPLARRLVFAADLDPATAVLECEVRAGKVDLSGPVDHLLGEAAARGVRELALEGFADLEGRVRYESRSGRLSLLHLSGQLIRCQLTPPGLPFPIQKLGGKFSVRGRAIDLKDLEGTFGEGRISGEASLDFDPSGGLKGLELFARAQAIPLDHRLRSKLEPGLRRIYDDLRPQGTVGLELRLRSRPFRLDLKALDLLLTLNGVDFAFRGMPYRFYGLTGEAALSGGRLVLKRPLTARNRDAVLTVTGHCDVADFLRPEGEAGPPGPPGELSFEARVENLPVDEELREALPPASRKVLDSFQPAGRIGLTVTARRGLESPTPAIAAFIAAQGVRISYSQFPYEITGITGRMHMEFHPGWSRLTLADLRGEHGGQPISGEGVVEWGERQMFRVDLKCDDLGLDDQLRAALSPNARQLLDDFNFHGRSKTEVTIHSTADGHFGVKVELDLISGGVSYLLFPYPLALAGGHLTAIGEHTLRFSNVVTRERRPDGTPERPKVVFNGGIGLEGGERLLDFRFDIEELDVDDRLRNVLPPDLRRFVEKLGLEGTFRGELTGTFTYPLGPLSASKPGSPPGASPADPQASPAVVPAGRLVYQARRVSARDAAVNFGVGIRRMEAEGEFVGGRDESGSHQFEGGVRVKSAAFNRLQLRDADISFTFGKEHPLASAARQGEPVSEGEFRPLGFFERLKPERARESFQMAVRRSDLYGGNVQGFLYIDVGKEQDFMGEFVASGIQVARAAPDVFGVADTGASGEARGNISFQGTTGDPQSIRGKGEGVIEKARLVELPLFVGMVGLLFGETTTQQFFNEVLIRFGIRGGKFRAASPDGIVIKSQGMHLKGGGTMDFEGKLNLSLSPEFLRMKIPLLDQVLGLLKKGLAQVWVSGDVARPRVRFVTGGGILQIPIDPRPRVGDRPLPRDLREEKEKEKEKEGESP